MTIADLFYVLKRLLISPAVIGATVAVTLFLQLFFYIFNYRKKNKTFSIRRIKRTPKAEPQEKPADDTDTEAEDAEV